jgi:hypothetical protein
VQATAKAAKEREAEEWEFSMLKKSGNSLCSTFSFRGMVNKLAKSIGTIMYFIGNTKFLNQL